MSLLCLPTKQKLLLYCIRVYSFFQNLLCSVSLWYYKQWIPARYYNFMVTDIFFLLLLSILFLKYFSTEEYFFFHLSGITSCAKTWRSMIWFGKYNCEIISPTFSGSNYWLIMIERQCAAVTQTMSHITWLPHFWQMPIFVPPPINRNVSSNSLSMTSVSVVALGWFWHRGLVHTFTWSQNGFVRLGLRQWGCSQ